MVKHSRKITFKDDASSTAGLSEGVPEEEEENGVGSHIMNFSHSLQALSECASHPPELTAELVKSLPKSLVVQREGLIPAKCLYGLAVALRNPAFRLTHLELELLPHHAHHTGGLLALARAMAENEHVQSLVVRWQSLSLLVTFLKTCLARAPPLHSVLLQDDSRRTTTGKNASAATWAGLQELCALLGNTRSVTLADCGSVHVVSQWVLYLPNTIQSLDFTGCAFNAISAADLGSKVQGCPCVCPV